MNLVPIRLLRGIGIGLLIWTLVVAGLTVFGTADEPTVDLSITKPFADIDTGGLPAVRRYRARDGVLLSYRQYPGSGAEVAVLLHGSAGSSVDMHPLAVALERQGVASLVPDIRGHGANQPHGDVAYIGQLEDDLVDLITTKRIEMPGSKWGILGFSSGAAFALRFAAELRDGKLVDRYTLVSPYLRYNAPSVRQRTSSTASHSWASVSLGRIIGLSMLNRIGVHLWDSLPVLAFPVPPDIEATTRTYSWRMYRNFAADDDYLADIRRAVRPMQFFVGGSDELLDAAQLKIEVQSQRPEVPVSILPGLGHSDMVTRADAIRVLAAAVQER